MQSQFKSVTWSFGKIPFINRTDAVPPRHIILTLQNVGGVASEFYFRMPNDVEVVVEMWADSGEPSEEESKQNYVIQKGFFAIFPKTGVLQPNETMDINLQYFPKDKGEHCLKILFHINHGKSLALKLVGETIQNNGKLDIIKNNIILNPTPIDLFTAVTYPLEIKNIGTSRIDYKVDLSKINEANHDFRIIGIENPEGSVEPYQTKYIHMYSRFIEQKQILFELPVNVFNSNKFIETLTFKVTGGGIHPNQPAKPLTSIFDPGLSNFRVSTGKPSGPTCSFSIEELDFGKVERGDPCRKMVILYNNHPSKQISFEFNKDTIDNGLFW